MPIENFLKNYQKGKILSKTAGFKSARSKKGKLR